MSVISRTRPLDSFQHGLAEGIQILHGANEIWSAANDIVGALPMFFTSKSTKALKDYKLYGADHLVNLVTDKIETANISGDGQVLVDPTEPGINIYELAIAPVVSGKTYTLNISDYDTGVVYAFFSSKPVSGSVSYNSTRYVVQDAHTYTVTAPITGYIALRDEATAPAEFISDGTTEGSGVACESGEPEGYKIPLVMMSQNLYDKNAKDTSNGYMENRSIVASTGATYIADSSYGSFITEYIPVKPNTVYTLDGIALGFGGSVASPGCCFYDENKAFIAQAGNAYIRSGGQWVANNKQVTSPSGAAYIRMNVSHATEDNAMLLRADQAPASYIPHDVDYNLYIGSSKLGKEEYVDYGEQKVYKLKVNTFDASLCEQIPKTSLSTRNKWTFNTGFTAIVLRYPCEANTEYTFICLVEGQQMYRLCTIDADTVPTTYSGIAVYDITKTLPADGQCTFTTRANDKWILFQPESSLVQDALNTIRLYKGASKYNPTDPPSPLPAITAYQGENTLECPEVVETFKQVEYIAANQAGSQLMIFDDLYADPTCKYELDLRFGGANSEPNRGFFGTIEFDSGGTFVTRFNANWGSASDTSFFAYMYENTVASQTILDSSIRTSRNTLILSPTTRSYGGTALSAPAATLPTTMSLPLVLFGVIEGDEVTDTKPFQQSDMFVYGFKIYDSQNVVIHNLVPVEKVSDSSKGLYDTVTGKFYGNSGSGSFTAGSYTGVEYPVYMELGEVTLTGNGLVKIN